jgi:uncharacterized protein (TIGR02246 family)
MSRALSTLGVLAMLAIVAAPTRAQEQGAKIVDDAWVKAANAGDVDAIVALYAPDAVRYAPDAMEARGTAAIRSQYQAMFAANTVSNASVNCTYQTVGDLSVGWGTATLTMTPKAGGAPQTMTVRVTTGVRKINGKWLHVADHASVPMPPTPGK